MLGKAFKKAVTKPVIGRLEAELFDETGVDIAEALDIVNNSTDDDASKDFSEKEIAVLTSCEAKSQIKNFEFSIEKVNSPGPKLKHCPPQLGKSDDDDFFKRNLLQLLQIDVNKPDVKRIINQRNKVPHMKENVKKSIKTGRDRALKEFFIESRFFHHIPKPILNSPRKLLITFDKDLGKELEAQTKYLSQSSFADHISSPNNESSRSLVFQVKWFSSSTWVPAVVTVCTESKVLKVSNKNSNTTGIVIKIKNIHFVKVEDNHLVVWLVQCCHTKDALEKDINDENPMAGIQFSTNKDCSDFLLVLDYLVHLSWPGRPHLLEGGNTPAKTPDKPVLYTAAVGWRPAGAGVNLEFAGKFRYCLQSAQKEIKSLEAAYFYLKAGVLYIYEFQAERLPFLSLPLPGCQLLVAGTDTDTPFLCIEVVGEGARGHITLTLFAETLGEAARLYRVAGIAERWQAEDKDDILIPCYLGVCDDRLVCFKIESQAHDSSEPPDIRIISPQDKDDMSCTPDNGAEQQPGQVLGGDGGAVHSFVWCIEWGSVLNIAVDYHNCNIQIAWLTGPSITVQRKDSMPTMTPDHHHSTPELGGTAVFTCATEVSKFVEMLEKCAEHVAVLPINSRLSQQLAACS